MGYRQLSEQERYVIGRLFRQHRSVRFIASIIGGRRPPSAANFAATPPATTAPIDPRKLINMPSPGAGEAGAIAAFALKIGSPFSGRCSACGAQLRLSGDAA
jgi:hypothetical protein